MDILICNIFVLKMLIQTKFLIIRIHRNVQMDKMILVIRTLENCTFSELKIKYLEYFRRIKTFNVSNVVLKVLPNGLRDRGGDLITVDLSNNEIKHIDSLAFEKINYVQFQDLSSNDLSTLHVEVFKFQERLQTLNVSNNRLIEIPAHLFNNAKIMTYVDFSNNKINYVDAKAFEGASNFISINLSYNHVNSGSLCNIFAVDPTYNNFTSINVHLFDKSVDLKHLNLSFNPLGTSESEA